MSLPAFESLPVRVCNSKSLNNNADVTKQNSKRYFVQNPAAHVGSFAPKFSAPATNAEDVTLTEPATANVVPQKFVPYTSILSSFLSAEETNEPGMKVPAAKPPSRNLEKKKQQKMKLLKTKVMNPLNKNNIIKLKNDQQVKVKKEKCNSKKKPKKTSAVVVIDDSSGCSDDDDVIPVEGPPPLIINLIDSSDAESVVSKNDFTFPKKVPHHKQKPRAISPSNSSVMSDDFIVVNDKGRLNDSFSHVPVEPESLYSQLTVDNVTNKSISEANSVRNKTLEDLNAQKPSSAESDSTEVSSCEPVLKKIDNAKKDSIKDSR